MRPTLRLLAVAAVVVLAVALQVSLFTHLALYGVVPDLALLVVVAAGLVRGPRYAALLGFAAGMVLDLAPPADHTAGRWALALVLVGYLVGLTRPEGRPPFLGTVLLVAAGTFVGTSVFALTGIALDEPGVDVGSALQMVPLTIVYDVLLTPVVVPLVLLLFRRLEPAERW